MIIVEHNGLTISQVAEAHTYLLCDYLTNLVQKPLLVDESA